VFPGGRGREKKRKSNDLKEKGKKNEEAVGTLPIKKKGSGTGYSWEGRKKKKKGGRKESSFRLNDTRRRRGKEKGIRGDILKEKKKGWKRKRAKILCG